MDIYSFNSSNDLYEDNLDDFFNEILDNFGSNTNAGLTPYQWVAMCIHGMIFILGVPGNALVVWLTLFEMKKSVNTVWFLNLSIADLFCCLSVPFTIMEIALGSWPLSLAACKFIPTVLLINMYASVLLLTLISIDRCLLVVKPVWCQNKRTVKKAYLACLVVWLLALILTSPSFHFRTLKKKFNSETESCVYYFPFSKDNIKKFVIFLAIFRFLMGFIIPFIIITICYSVLAKKVMERYSQSGKTMKVVTVVIVAFFVCWFPYHISSLIMASHHIDTEVHKLTSKVDPILISIAFINSCINPMIYVLAGQDFKSKFKKSIKSVIRNVLEDEQSQSFDSRKSKSSSETKNTNAYV